MTQALWITGPREVECRKTTFNPAGDHLEIETLFTGISRGTEKLVFEGRVPEGEYTTMRAPFQEGEFPYPVKYGYAAVGRVQGSSRDGEVVFALFPHQADILVPAEAALPVPSDVPAERAVLAANMETALNIVWDAGIQAGDRVAVVGCGVVGALTGYLAARIPGTEVCMTDIDPERAKLAETLGCCFALPERRTGRSRCRDPCLGHVVWARHGHRSRGCRIHHRRGELVRHRPHRGAAGWAVSPASAAHHRLAGRDDPARTGDALDLSPPVAQGAVVAE